MTLAVECPNCTQSFSLSPDYIGGEVECVAPSCRHHFVTVELFLAHSTFTVPDRTAIVMPLKLIDRLLLWSGATLILGGLGWMTWGLIHLIWTWNRLLFSFLT